MAWPQLTTTLLPVRSPPMAIFLPYTSRIQTQNLALRMLHTFLTNPSNMLMVHLRTPKGKACNVDRVTVTFACSFLPLLCLDVSYSSYTTPSLTVGWSATFEDHQGGPIGHYGFQDGNFESWLRRAFWTQAFLVTSLNHCVLILEWNVRGILKPPNTVDASFASEGILLHRQSNLANKG